MISSNLVVDSNLVVGVPLVQTPAPAEHPSVGAPKCIDCRHHRTRQRDKSWQARDLCGHPTYSRSLITGEPNQSCADARGTHTIGLDGDRVPCGPTGTLYQAADDDGGPVVTRAQLASALAGVLDVLDAATVVERISDEPCKTSPRVMHARSLLEQLETEAQP